MICPFGKLLTVLLSASTANAAELPLCCWIVTTPLPLAVAASTSNPLEAVGLGVGDGVRVGIGVGVGVCVGTGVGVGLGVVVGVGDADADELGVGETDADGLAVGETDALGDGDAPVVVGAGDGVASVDVVLNNTKSYVVPASSVSEMFGKPQPKIVSFTPAPATPPDEVLAGPARTVHPAVGLFGSSRAT